MSCTTDIVYIMEDEVVNELVGCRTLNVSCTTDIINNGGQGRGPMP